MKIGKYVVAFIIFIVIIFFILTTAIESYAAINTNPVLGLSGLTLAFIASLLLANMFRKK